APYQKRMAGKISGLAENCQPQMSCASPRGTVDRALGAIFPLVNGEFRGDQPPPPALAPLAEHLRIYRVALNADTGGRGRFGRGDNQHEGEWGEGVDPSLPPSWPG
ncbi:MAG: hypothetical protein FWF31_07445, partial [Desulfobulbus sp.]|nr:hypothetical protein [Desulfobulbus sp.]